MKETLGAIQKEFLTWKFGLFFHFGIRTFYPGRTDWDRIPMDADRFSPDELDCDQWMETAKKQALLIPSSQPSIMTDLRSGSRRYRPSV